MTIQERYEAALQWAIEHKPEQYPPKRATACRRAAKRMTDERLFAFVLELESANERAKNRLGM